VLLALALLVALLALALLVAPLLAAGVLLAALLFTGLLLDPLLAVPPATPREVEFLLGAAEVVALLAVLFAAVLFALLTGLFPAVFAVVADFVAAVGRAALVVPADALVPARAVDRAAGAAADRAADVVRPARDEAELLVAAMAYRPLPG
jgi:hypothetical protein